MKKIIYTLLVILLLCSACSKPTADADYNIIPLPQTVEANNEGQFVLDAQTTICHTQHTDEQKKTATLLAQYIEQATGLKLRIREKEDAKENAIVLSTNTQTHAEGYKLTVGSTHISIEGADEAGLFYGVQTLRKSIPAGSKSANITFAGVTIEDYPRFAFRSMMLDVSRHFSTAEYLKRHIDILALHNFNKFHLHLTEDQGWRIEIKKYPKLTEIGSKRKETIKGFITGEYDGTPHEGYYTQDQLKEVVQYAKDRHIEIIPEVDLPGHMLAALASYPELGCTGGPYAVATKWGIHSDVLCAGNEATYEFLEGVLSEIFEIFPTQYIHIGGDECPKAKWKACPKCQTKIKELGLKGDAKYSKEERLQSYLTHRLQKFISSKGRKLVGWDEIMEGGLAPNATVMSWRGDDGGRAAAKMGRDVVMCPNSNLYFDYYQTENTATEPAAFPEANTISEVYNYEPIPKGLTDDEAKHVIGVQANLWVEQISSSNHVEYMTLPRLAALAELQWTNVDRKDYNQFLNRLGGLVMQYDQLGYNFSVVPFGVDAEIMENKENKTIELKLSTFDQAPIYYTIDGSEPTANSTKYTSPINIKGKVTLKAKAIRDKQKITNKNLYIQSFDFNKATFKKVELLTETSKYFTPPRGAELLTDGRRGNGCHVFGKVTTWIGFGGTMGLLVDLEKVTDISSVKTSVILVPNSKGAEYKVSLSEDGKIFEEVHSKHEEFNAIADLTTSLENKKARYVRIEVKADNYAHVLADEIEIN